MKNKKGFTLIELLAVIVILAIISIIAVPIVLNIIDTARRGSAESSANGYIDAVEYYNASLSMKGQPLMDGTYDVADLDIKLDGKKPAYGTVTIKKGIVESADICINGYIVEHKNNKSKSHSTCTGEADDVKPILTIGEIKKTTNRIEINFIAKDLESGIDNTTCEYGTTKEYGTTGKLESITNGPCIIENANQDTTYYYKITTIDKNKNETTVTGNTSPESILKPIVTSDPNWSTNKVVNIEYKGTGITTPAYFIKSTVNTTSDVDVIACNSELPKTASECTGESTKEITKDTWYLVPSTEINLTLNENGSIYTSTSDGLNIASSDVYTVTTIDAIAPMCTYSGNSTQWTNESRTIYWGCSDGEGESGCDSEYSGGSTIFDKENATTKVSVISSYTIKDNAGNTTICPAKAVDVYVDRQAPTCTHSGDAIIEDWTNANRTIYWGCSDGTGQSGCNGLYSGGTTTFSFTTRKATIPQYTIKDNAGNENLCVERIANVYVDKTPPTCTNSGDSTEWTKESRTIYFGCSDDQSGCDSDYSGGSYIFKDTTKNATIPMYYIKDKAKNQTACPTRTANVYVDKTPPILTVNAYQTTTKSEASGYTASTPYTDNTWYNGWVWVNAKARDNESDVTLYYTREPDATYGGSGAQNKTKTATGGNVALINAYSDAIGISNYSYYACDTVNNCTTDNNKPPATVTVKLDRPNSNFGKYHCTYYCTTCCDPETCDTTYLAVDSAGDPYIDSSGKCGNIITKVDFNQSTNVLSYGIYQGEYTYIGEGYGIYLKNNSSVLGYIKRSNASRPTNNKYEGSITISPGLYTKFWIDGDSETPYYDLNLGKLIVS